MITHFLPDDHRFPADAQLVWPSEIGDITFLFKLDAATQVILDTKWTSSAECPIFHNALEELTATWIGHPVLTMPDCSRLTAFPDFPTAHFREHLAPSQVTFIEKPPREEKKRGRKQDVNSVT